MVRPPARSRDDRADDGKPGRGRHGRRGAGISSGLAGAPTLRRRQARPGGRHLRRTSTPGSRVMLTTPYRTPDQIALVAAAPADRRLIMTCHHTSPSPQPIGASRSSGGDAGVSRTQDVALPVGRRWRPRSVRTKAGRASPPPEPFRRRAARCQARPAEPLADGRSRRRGCPIPSPARQDRPLPLDVARPERAFARGGFVRIDRGGRRSDRRAPGIT